MDNKKIYNAPSLEIEVIDEKDIVTTSVSVGEWGNGDGDVIEF